MIEEPPILRVKARSKRPSEQQLAALRNVPTAYLTDAMDGRGALDPDIRPLSANVLPTRMCGVALTCQCGPADVLAVLAGLSELRSGDILVAATGSWRQSAVVGDRVMGMVKNGGGIGFLTDGLVRDVEGINAVGLPVFCTGLSPNSPYANGPGEIGFPVQLGGLNMCSGDVIVGDDNGAVVVPYDRLDEIIAAVEHITELENELDARVAAGLAVPDDIAELMRSDQVHRT